MTIKVGINGLGRIGRAIVRILLERADIEIVAVNDINPDIENMAYLLKYDSTYGKLPFSVTTGEHEIIIGNEKRMHIFHHHLITDVPWEKYGVEVVVDSSGVRKNLLEARNLKGRVKRCIVTHSPPSTDVDRTIILGANEQEWDPKKDFLLSSSICDANAFAPVAKVLDNSFGITHGFLTTLHPWLNYQNLLDGPSISYATPGEIHDYYALGRASTGSLIPKTTSAIKASEAVLKSLRDKFLSMSYRVPTMIVSSADLSVQLEKQTTLEEVKQAFEEMAQNQKWNIIYNNKEALVSTDFTGCASSAVVDHRWMRLNEHNYLKMVLWYDNEWGYSSRVVDLIAYISQ